MRRLSIYLIAMVLTTGSTLSQSAELAESAPAATDFFNQDVLATLSNNQTSNLDEIPQIFYDYYVITETSRLRARLNLWERFGLNKDDLSSQQGQALLKILNRNRVNDLRFENLLPGDTLIVPTEFGLDLRAYSPFPRYYPGAEEIEKLIILHKEIQAFGAYNFGKLIRWGIINTGTEGTRTPEGRFNVNWKEELRISTESPGIKTPSESDEMWEMRWVMNIYEERGIHMHQYDIPAGGPASHGCVRIPDADARWMYSWTDGFAKDRRGRISKQGTMVLVIGPDPVDHPQPFIHKRSYPILRIVDIPADPFSVPPGTRQQEIFDTRRAG